MCDKPELNISTFVSTNESVIDYLLDITDEVEETLTVDKYKWVAGLEGKSHGGFVRKMDINGKEGFKAFIIPKTKKLSMIKIDGMDPGIENSTEMESETRIVGNDNSVTFYKKGELMGTYDMCPFNKSEIELDMLEIPEDLEINDYMDTHEENGNIDTMNQGIVDNLKRLDNNLSGGAALGALSKDTTSLIIEQLFEILNLIVSTTTIKIDKVGNDTESSESTIMPTDAKAAERHRRLSLQPLLRDTPKSAPSLNVNGQDGDAEAGGGGSGGGVGSWIKNKIKKKLIQFAEKKMEECKKNPSDCKDQILSYIRKFIEKIPKIIEACQSSTKAKRKCRTWAEIGLEQLPPPERMKNNNPELRQIYKNFREELVNEINRLFGTEMDNEEMHQKFKEFQKKKKREI